MILPQKTNMAPGAGVRFCAGCWTPETMIKVVKQEIWFLQFNVLNFDIRRSNDKC